MTLSLKKTTSLSVIQSCWRNSWRKYDQVQATYPPPLQSMSFSHFFCHLFTSWRWWPLPPVAKGMTGHLPMMAIVTSAHHPCPYHHRAATPMLMVTITSAQWWWQFHHQHAMTCWCGHPCHLCPISIIALYVCSTSSYIIKFWFIALSLYMRASLQGKSTNVLGGNEMPTIFLI